MTPDEFWRGDPALVRAYRKAEELRRERKNQEQWWQGMYIYEAICNASPLLRAFGKKGAKAIPYPKEPYDISPPKKHENAEQAAERKKMLSAKAKMLAWKAQVHTNRKQQKGGTTVNGGQRNDDRQPTNTN